MIEDLHEHLSGATASDGQTCDPGSTRALKARSISSLSHSLFGTRASLRTRSSWHRYERSDRTLRIRCSWPYERNKVRYERDPPFSCVSTPEHGKPALRRCPSRLRSRRKARHRCRRRRGGVGVRVGRAQARSAVCGVWGRGDVERRRSRDKERRRDKESAGKRAISIWPCNDVPVSPLPFITYSFSMIHRKRNYWKLQTMRNKRMM